jgi:HAD superfamily hydrolase (TIGR01509 family)
MIDTVIIDLDGPVLDGQLRHYQCYRDIVTERGHRAMSLERYWDMKRHRVDRRSQLAATGAEALYDTFLPAWLQRIESPSYLALDRLQPGVHDKLEEWTRMGVRLVLVTMRRDHETLAWQLDTLELRHHFDSVVAVGPIEPDVAKAAAAKSYLAPSSLERTLWVGDTEVDIAAARRVGVKVCAVTCGLRTRDFLASLRPDSLVSDMSAIHLDTSVAQ